MKHTDSRSLRRAAAVATALLFTFPAEQLFAFLSDAGIYPAPNYYTFRPPARGGSYSDPVFGTSIKRISDALNTPDNAGGGMLNFITNEYSTMTPFNKDNTRLILVHQSYFAVYDGNGNYLRDLPFAVHASSQPRWSRSNAKLLYFVNGNTLYTVDVDSLVVSVVRAFGEYGSISGHGESDICFDGNHLVLVGDGRDVFVWMQNAEPISLFCADETDGESLRACEQVTEALYTYEVNGTAVVPALAEVCEPNDALDVWVCTLRQGVTFHDGTTFDANDVVASWSVGLDAANPLHVGNTGVFEYFAYLWGSLMNAPPA